MMSKTHIAVGVASALTIAHTGSVESCLAAILGGSIGGIIADCDITPSRAHKDALIGRLAVVGIAVVSLAVDYHFSAGICDYIVGNVGMKTIAGVVLFAALTFVGGHTDHRSFTHSLVAMASFCGACYLACEPLLPFFAMGYASHLVLDVTNHQPIRLFWPARKGVSIGLCLAKGVANSVVLGVGLVACVMLIAYRLYPLVSAAISMC